MTIPGFRTQTWIPLKACGCLPAILPWSSRRLPILPSHPPFPPTLLRQFLQTPTERAAGLLSLSVPAEDTTHIPPTGKGFSWLSEWNGTEGIKLLYFITVCAPTVIRCPKWIWLWQSCMCGPMQSFMTLIRIASLQ